LSENLPSNLKIIEFGDFYNKTLPKKLPDCLETIVFGDMYNQSLRETLPQSLSSIEFGYLYNQPLPQNLPHHLNEIVFNTSVYSKTKNLGTNYHVKDDFLYKNEKKTNVQVFFRKKNVWF